MQETRNFNHATTANATGGDWVSSDMDDLDRELAQIEAGDRQTLRSSFSGMGARVISITLATMVILVFGAIIWYAYSEGVLSGSEGAAPLLRPDGPAKVQPDDPGGLEIPHQDKLVYNTVNKNSDDAKVERLIPPPEPPKMLPRYPDAEQALQNAENLENPTASTTPPHVSVPLNNTLEVAKNTQQDAQQGTKSNALTLPDATVADTVQANPLNPAPANLATAGEVSKTKPVVIKPANSASAPKQTEAQQSQPPPNKTKQEKTKPASKTTEITAVAVPKKQTTSPTAYWRIQIAALNSEAAAQKQWATYQKNFLACWGKCHLIFKKRLLRGVPIIGYKQVGCHRVRPRPICVVG